jgi:hypothetical protein
VHLPLPISQHDASGAHSARADGGGGSARTEDQWSPVQSNLHASTRQAANDVRTWLDIAPAMRLLVWDTDLVGRAQCWVPFLESVADRDDGA